MFRNLHPVIKVAGGILILNFIVAPVGTLFFDRFLSGPMRMIGDFLASWGNLPHGILLGAAAGMVAALYLLRGRSPDWYKRFDVKSARFDHERISIQSILRECIDKRDAYQFVRQKQFFNCEFHGPAMIYLADDTTLGQNTWNRMGTPLLLGMDETLTGCAGFQGCHFEGCTFHHITPIIPVQRYDAFLKTFPEAQRHVLKPALKLLEEQKTDVLEAQDADEKQQIEDNAKPGKN